MVWRIASRAVRPSVMSGHPPNWQCQFDCRLPGGVRHAGRLIQPAPSTVVLPTLSAPNTSIHDEAKPFGINGMNSNNRIGKHEHFRS
jgi:hypothetical protein